MESNDLSGKVQQEPKQGLLNSLRKKFVKQPKESKMEKYIGIKFVEAVPMSRRDAEKNGYKTADENEGYEVTYEEGYKSWCPKSVFEKHNRRVVDEDFAATALGMVDPNYKARFKAEYTQTRIRFEKLHKMIIKDEAGVLNFQPTCPLPLLREQEVCMRGYLRVLELRAEMEGVVLD